MGAPGFDDAPIFESGKASLPSYITMVYPYYENPEFLKKQVSHWLALPYYIRAWISVIIVDDGSPENPAAEVLSRISLAGLPTVSLYRIDVDIRWNWLAARNVGVHHALDGWCVLTDMDHMLPEATLDKLLYRAYDEEVIYRFSRRESSGIAIHPHPNSMFMAREMFWKVGGYDEALSGHYGTDGDWRRRCAATAKILTLKQELIRHEYDGDSSTTRYLRKQPEDAGKKAIIKKRGAGWKPKTLSFPYHEVKL